MAHAHAHSHGEGEGTYFLDQLFTILASGAVGLVAILMYLVVDPPKSPNDPAMPFLNRILVPWFFPLVFAGGIAILAMACIRGIAIWQLAGQWRKEQAVADHRNDHGHGHDHSHGGGHDHAHGDDCGHDHAHDGECDHDHSHAHAHSHASVADDEGHDHNWAPWRYMVIVIPVFIYFLGLPRAGFTEQQIGSQIAKGGLADPNRRALSLLGGAPVMTKVLRKAQPEVRDLRTPIGGKDGFALLSETAALPALHDAWDGDTVILRGQFMKLSNNEFTLVYTKRTCCNADTIFLEARIVSPDAVQITGSPEVEVRGTLSFQQSERGKWVPVITLDSGADVTVVD